MNSLIWGRGGTGSSSVFPTTPQERSGETPITGLYSMSQGWVSGKSWSSGPIPVVSSGGVGSSPPTPIPLIQAWQQIPWQCAGQNPLFLTHEACGWCHVLWGSCSWVPPSWAQRALTKGGEVAGGLDDREVVCIHTYVPTHISAPGHGSGYLCLCVRAHCSRGMSQGISGLPLTLCMAG